MFQLKWHMPERMEDIQRCILYPAHIVHTYVCIYMQSCQFPWTSDNNADSQKKNPSQQHIGECLMTLFDVICPVKRSNKLKQWKITLKAILYESSELICGWELHISITEEIQYACLASTILSWHHKSVSFVLKQYIFCMAPYVPFTPQCWISIACKPTATQHHSNQLPKTKNLHN